MIRYRWHVNARQLLDAIRSLRTAIEAGAFREPLAQAGIETLTWLTREFKGRARMDWRRLSMITVVTSRGRVTRPIESWRSLWAAVRRAQPLIDTGGMLASFTRGRPDNIFRLGNHWVEIGSSNPFIAKHQHEHQSVFNFDAEKRANFERNVPARIVSFATFIKGLGGETSRRATRPRGNPVHGGIKAILEKIDGKAFKIPARPLPTVPPAAIVTRLRRNAARILKERWEAARPR